MASTHRATGRAAGNSDKIMIPKGVQNSLLEKLTSELNGGVLPEIPKDAVSAQMLSEATGFSLSNCEKRLKARETNGELKRVLVRPAGQKMPRVFFVQNSDSAAARTR